MKENRKRVVAAVAAVAATAAIAGALYLTTPEVHAVHLPVVYTSHQTLKSEFAEHGIRFGFAVSSGSFTNPVTGAIIEEHASVVTTEVAMKMGYTQPQQGTFDFAEADAIVAYADERDVDVHGHTASWSLQNPAWLNTGNFTKAELKYILTNHVHTLSQHYNNKLVGMDVANEGYLSCGAWCPLGTNSYVNLSFAAAGSGTPRIYNSIFPTRAEEDYALALLDAGTIDGIGLQLHLATTTDWRRKLGSTDVFLDKIRRHGGTARFSEVGVHMQNASEAEQQAVIFAAVAALAVKYSDIVTDFVVWGIVPPMWRGDTGLFDSSGEAKLSYYAVIEELGQ